MRSGVFAWGRSRGWKTVFATRRLRRSKRFRSLGRRARSPRDDPRVKAIAEAAKDLVEKRDAWLNPPGTTELERKDRTLTNLYNKRPAWLADAHRKLDESVFAAYGWPPTLTDSEILERLLALNHERAAKSAGPSA